MAVEPAFTPFCNQLILANDELRKAQPLTVSAPFVSPFNFFTNKLNGAAAFCEHNWEGTSLEANPCGLVKFLYDTYCVSPSKKEDIAKINGNREIFELKTKNQQKKILDGLQTRLKEYQVGIELQTGGTVPTFDYTSNLDVEFIRDLLTWHDFQTKFESFDDRLKFMNTVLSDLSTDVARIKTPYQLIVENSGTGYTITTKADAGEPVSGGEGSDMTIRIVGVNSEGAVTNYEVMNDGTGYGAGDQVTVLQSGSGEDFKLKITTSDLDKLKKRIQALEDQGVPPDHSTTIATLQAKITALESASSTVDVDAIITQVFNATDVSEPDKQALLSTLLQVHSIESNCSQAGIDSISDAHCRLNELRSDLENVNTMLTTQGTSHTNLKGIVDTLRGDIADVLTKDQVKGMIKLQAPTVDAQAIVDALTAGDGSHYNTLLDLLLQCPPTATNNNCNRLKDALQNFASNQTVSALETQLDALDVQHNTLAERLASSEASKLDTAGVLALVECEDTSKKNNKLCQTIAGHKTDLVAIQEKVASMLATDANLQSSVKAVQDFNATIQNLAVAEAVKQIEETWPSRYEELTNEFLKEVAAQTTMCKDNTAGDSPGNCKSITEHMHDLFSDLADHREKFTADLDQYSDDAAVAMQENQELFYSELSSLRRTYLSADAAHDTKNEEQDTSIALLEAEQARLRRRLNEIGNRDSASTSGYVDRPAPPPRTGLLWVLYAAFGLGVALLIVFLYFGR